MRLFAASSSYYVNNSHNNKLVYIILGQSSLTRIANPALNPDLTEELQITTVPGSLFQDINYRLYVNG